MKNQLKMKLKDLRFEHGMGRRGGRAGRPWSDLKKAALQDFMYI